MNISTAMQPGERRQRRVSWTFLLLLWFITSVSGWAQSVMVEAAAKPGQEWKPLATQTLDALPAAIRMRTDSGLSVYGGQTNRQAKATGFFHTTKVDGRWWLVDPEGCLFLDKGVNSVTTIPTPGAQAAFQQKFGDLANWARATTKLLRDHGFDTVGAWSDTATLRAVAEPVAYTRIWNFMSAYGKIRGGTYQGEGHIGYPNDCIFVFDPAFEKFCDEYARQLAPQKNDPWLLGHFSDNEMPLRRTMLKNYLGLPAADPGHQAALDWLRARHGAEATVKDITEQDQQDFLAVVTERYFRIVSKAIKKYDPNHLFLGCRFNGAALRCPELFKAAGPFVDVISVNYYRVWTPVQDELAGWERESGKPILITEWYAKGVDSGLGNKSGSGWLVKTQRERGQFYENFTLGLLESKACVGWHWFRYIDNDPDDKTVDPSNTDANKGLLSNRYVPYVALLDSMKRLNQRAYGIISFFDNTPAAQRVQAVRPLDTGWEFYQGSLGSTWEIWRGDKATDNVTWTPVTLPHCFNARDAVDPDARYYQGPGWYRTRFKLANPFPDGRVLLHFDGAGQKSQVFVGLKKVGEHLGGFDQWNVDITDAVAKADTNGVVQLAVQCDNSRDAESIPSDLSDFNRYGGLYRHVSLVYVPAISLERVHIEPKLATDGKASVKVRGRLYNPSALKDETELVVEVRDPSGKPVHNSTQKLAPWSGEKEIATFEITAPKLWSPKSPALYSCTVTLKSPQGDQQLTQRFGVRSVEWVEHGPFKLNGERLQLHGTHYHEDHAGVAAAVPDYVVRQTLQAMKDMGVNFVRLGHYQQAPLVLELCDELGILAWEETPWCRGGLGGERYQQQGRDMLSNMIDQHYNHPSIILWGLGNENDWPGDFETFDKEKIRAYMTELNSLAHQLDPSRKTCIRRCEFCKDIPDVYSPSLWPGWYSGRYPGYRAALTKGIADVPHFFHAEFGGDSLAGRHSEEPEKFLTPAGASGKARIVDDGDWSESYIINLFDWYLKEQEQMTNLTGAAQWIFKDFATPLRPKNPVPRVNQKGVAERDGTLKESYYVFQSYWTEKPMVHIYGHTWPVRWGKAGEEKEVKVFSNCREVELFVNGVSAGVKQRVSTNFPAAGLRWNVKLNDGTNTLRAVGKSTGPAVTDEISVAYQTATWSAPAQLILSEISRRNSVVTIEARAFDQNGVPCLDAANVVRFGITGDGQLLDNLGTAGGSRVVQLANGRAQINLQLTGAKASASVASEGLLTQFLEVTNTVAATAVSAAPKLMLDVAAIDRERILKAANAALAMKPVTITAFRAKLSEGGANDFYSNGDYWWPDPTKPDGLPYIQRDGESNPDNFSQHRLAVRDLRDGVAALAAAYKITGDDRYAQKAAELLRVFFLDPPTRMNPHLKYAQAIPGKSPGRGLGIIDALHLAEVPPAIAALQKSKAFPPEVLAGMKQWFTELSEWMITSKNGQEEATAKNNHAVAFWLQIASFARLTGDEAKLAECRRQFKEVFVPKQMAADGSFPLELKRTKPYAYSIFQLDNMTTLCQVLSTPDDDLWTFELPDGRSIRKAAAYLYPFLADKSKWPLKPDVQAWENWPARQPCLLFAGLAFSEQPYLELWKKLPPDSTDSEVRRNIAITQPILWLKDSSETEKPKNRPADES